MAAGSKPSRSRKRSNGEGAISGPRKNGRYVGAFACWDPAMHAVPENLGGSGRGQQPVGSGVASRRDRGRSEGTDCAEQIRRHPIGLDGTGPARASQHAGERRHRPVVIPAIDGCRYRRSMSGWPPLGQP